MVADKSYWEMCEAAAIARKLDYFRQYIVDQTL